MKHNRLFPVLVLGIIGIASCCFSQHASFLGLGDFPDGTFESSAQSVSSDGSVVVGYGTAASGAQAFRWTASTGLASLGNLPDSSFKMSWAENISGDGNTIVGYGDPVGSGWDTYQGFIWNQTDWMTEMGSLDGSTRFMAFDVSADGSVVVGDGGQQAFFWKKDSGIMGLGALPGRSNSRAIGVSADGSVVTGSSYTSTWTSEETFRWTQDEGMQGLGRLAGTSNSFPNAISPDGSVIAGTSVSSSRAFAYRWSQSAGMVNIGYLPGTYTTHPGGVSLNGEIIVGGSYVDMTNGWAFIWDFTHGMRNLKTVLQTEYGLDLTGWTLQNASGITPDGNVIVGWGINPSGKQEAYRVVLDTTVTGVHQANEEGLPTCLELQQNYPNPFNPSTFIRYSLAKPSQIRLSIFDLLGKTVKTLVDSHQPAGEYSLVWDATDHTGNPVSSGMYFYHLETDDTTLQKKMVLVR